jgi:hypothetical protein
MTGDQKAAPSELRIKDKVGAFTQIIMSTLLVGESLQGLSAGGKYFLLTIPFAAFTAFVCASTIFIVIRRFRANDRRRIFPPQANSWGEHLVITSLGLPVFVAVLTMGILLTVGQHSTLIGRAIGVVLLLGVTAVTRANLRVVPQAYHFWRTSASYPATKRDRLTRLQERKRRPR